MARGFTAKGLGGEIFVLGGMDCWKTDDSEGAREPQQDQDTLLGVGWGVLIWIHSGRIQVCALADIKLEYCEY